MHRRTLALLCGLLASSASASTWVRVAQAPTGAVLLDTDSVLHNGPVRTFRVEFMKSGAPNSPIAYEIDHWSIDCAKMTIASLAIMQFDPSGKAVPGNNQPAYYPEWVPIAPKSIGFELYHLVCR